METKLKFGVIEVEGVYWQYTVLPEIKLIQAWRHYCRSIAAVKASFLADYCHQLDKL